MEAGQIPDAMIKERDTFGEKEKGKKIVFHFRVAIGNCSLEASYRWSIRST